MKSINYLKNIHCLGQTLKIPNLLKHNNLEDISLILNEHSPFLLQINYHSDSELVTISSPISHALPKKLSDLQNFMIKFVDDLLKPEKLGKLSLDPQTNTLSFIAEVSLEEGNEHLLAEKVPKIIEEAKSWREKLIQSFELNKLPSREEEILDFRLPSFLS